MHQYGPVLDFPIKSKIVAITGGGSGIGKWHGLAACAQEVGEHRWGIVLGVMRALIMNNSKNRRSQYNFPTPDRSPKRAP